MLKRTYNLKINLICGLNFSRKHVMPMPERQTLYYKPVYISPVMYYVMPILLMGKLYLILPSDTPQRDTGCYRSHISEILKSEHKALLNQICCNTTNALTGSKNFKIHIQFYICLHRRFLFSLSSRGITLSKIIEPIKYLYMPFQLYTVYREIFTPVLFSPLSHLLSVGEFKTRQILMSYIISL